MKAWLAAWIIVWCFVCAACAVLAFAQETYWSTRVWLFLSGVACGMLVTTGLLYAEEDSDG